MLVSRCSCVIFFFFVGVGGGFSDFVMSRVVDQVIDKLGMTHRCTVVVADTRR